MSSGRQEKTVDGIPAFPRVRTRSNAPGSPPHMTTAIGAPDSSAYSNHDLAFSNLKSPPADAANLFLFLRDPSGTAGLPCKDRCTVSRRTNPLEPGFQGMSGLTFSSWPCFKL